MQKGLSAEPGTACYMVAQVTPGSDAEAKGIEVRLSRSEPSRFAWKAPAFPARAASRGFLVPSRFLCGRPEKAAFCVDGPCFPGARRSKKKKTPSAGSDSPDIGPDSRTRPALRVCPPSGLLHAPFEKKTEISFRLVRLLHSPSPHRLLHAHRMM